MSKPELWGECKRICTNCPNETDDTKKVECLHPWRHEVKDHLELSGNGTVPFDMPEVCHSLGATVSRHLMEGGDRPDVQLFVLEPIEKAAYQKFKVSEY